MVVGTDQQEEGKARGIKKRGTEGERGREGGKEGEKKAHHRHQTRVNTVWEPPSLSPSFSHSGSADWGPGVIRVDPALCCSAFILPPSFIPSFPFFLPKKREEGAIKTVMHPLNSSFINQTSAVCQREEWRTLICEHTCTQKKAQEHATDHWQML